MTDNQPTVGPPSPLTYLSRSIEFAAAVPAVAAVLLATTYGAGLASLSASARTADVPASDVIPLFSLEDVLRQGMVSVFRLVFLGIVFVIVIAFMFIYATRVEPLTKPAIPDDLPPEIADPLGRFQAKFEKATRIVSRVLGVVGVVIVVLSVSPVLAATVVLSLAVAGYAVLVLAERGYQRRVRVPITVALAIFIVLIGNGIEEFAYPRPLPEAIITRIDAPLIHGKSLTHDTTNWYLATDQNTVVAIPTSQIRNVRLASTDYEGPPSLWRRIFGD